MELAHKVFLTFTFLSIPFIFYLQREKMSMSSYYFENAISSTDNHYFPPAKRMSETTSNFVIYIPKGIKKGTYAYFLRTKDLIDKNLNGLITGKKYDKEGMYEDNKWVGGYVRLENIVNMEVKEEIPEDMFMILDNSQGYLAYEKKSGAKHGYYFVHFDKRKPFVLAFEFVKIDLDNSNTFSKVCIPFRGILSRPAFPPGVTNESHDLKVPRASNLYLIDPDIEEYIYSSRMAMKFKMVNQHIYLHEKSGYWISTDSLAVYAKGGVIQFLHDSPCRVVNSGIKGNYVGNMHNKAYLVFGPDENPTDETEDIKSLVQCIYFDRNENTWYLGEAEISMKIMKYYLLATVTYDIDKHYSLLYEYELNPYEMDKEVNRKIVLDVITKEPRVEDNKKDPPPKDSEAPVKDVPKVKSAPTSPVRPVAPKKELPKIPVALTTKVVGELVKPTVTSTVQPGTMSEIPGLPLQDQMMAKLNAIEQSQKKFQEFSRNKFKELKEQIDNIDARLTIVENNDDTTSDNAREIGVLKERMEEFEKHVKEMEETLAGITEKEETEVDETASGANDGSTELAKASFLPS